MAQSIILKRSSLPGKVPDTGSLNAGELAINTYDGKIFIKRSGNVDTIQSVLTTDSTTTGSITLTQTGSFGELLVSQDANIQRDLYVIRDIITNNDIDAGGDISGSGLQVNDTLNIIHGNFSLSASTSITGAVGIDGDLTILGAVNARQFNIGIISSSIMYTSGSNKFGDTIDDTHQFTGSVLINGTLTATGISGSFNIPDSSTLQVGSQIFYPQGNNGFSVNEDFDASNNSSQTAYHYTSGAGRSSVVFTLARTGQFTNGFGISGSSSNNTFISFGEQSNTNFEWRKGVGIQPVNLSGGTLLAKLDTNGKFWATSISSSTGITGSIAATNGVISGSSQLTSSYDARYALSGSSAGTGPNTFDFNLDPEAAGTVNFIEDSTGNTQAISKTGSFDIEIGGTNHLSISSSAINVTTGSITANYMHLAKYITIEGHLDFNI